MLCPRGAGNQPTAADWVDHSRTGHPGKEKLRASQIWEHPQQGVCVLRLPSGMNSKVQWVTEVYVSGAKSAKGQSGQVLRDQGLFPKEAPPFPRKPHCYPGCTITPSKASKTESHCLSKSNKYKLSYPEGTLLGPATTEQL